jgi:hypothetical protein
MEEHENKGRKGGAEVQQFAPGLRNWKMHPTLYPAKPHLRSWEEIFLISYWNCKFKFIEAKGQIYLDASK